MSGFQSGNYYYLHRSTESSWGPTASLLDDLHLKEACHLMIATRNSWNTSPLVHRQDLEVVSRPFYQLMYVHAFQKEGNNVKQVLLHFALMSGCRQSATCSSWYMDVTGWGPENISLGSESGSEWELHSRVQHLQFSQEDLCPLLPMDHKR